MKKYILAFCFLLGILPASVYADNADDPADPSGPLRKLVRYLDNLGINFGYDLKTDPSFTPASALLNIPMLQNSELFSLYTVFGALPINAMFNSFVPQDGNTSYSGLNSWANAVFLAQNYSDPAKGADKVSVVRHIDQEPYQQDPVSQALLNIVATPDYSVCLTGAGVLDTNCSALYQNKILEQIIGNIPGASQLYSNDYVQQFLSQLNGNSLIAPLLYSTASHNANPTSSESSVDKEKHGLPAKNQAQQAADFIRYATGAVTPLALPKLSDYSALYAQSQNLTQNYSQIEQMQAETTLNTYLAQLRIYAAQSSVAIGNLYYILSKRLPQQASQGATSSTSQALSEFQMAAWRLQNPAVGAQEQWLTQINSASPAAIQKEIAILLAEINYQLYLSRQQDERTLLTNSLLLIQGLTANKPSLPSGGNTAAD